jgi:hypothetical protein
MGQPLNFSARELSYLQNTDFLLTKWEIMQKVKQLMRETEKLIRKDIPRFQKVFPEATLDRAGKLSKGENYQGLPYVVLDYPRNFSKEHIFAFRTMFWWGHHFSITLHLQGEYFNRYKQMLAGNFARLQAAGYYVCVHDTPWEYHYEFENYQPLANFSVADFQTELDQRTFTKLSRKLSLEAWAELPLFANETFSQLMTYLENKGTVG